MTPSVWDQGRPETESQLRELAHFRNMALILHANLLDVHAQSFRYEYMRIKVLSFTIQVVPSLVRISI
jgi:hypothetical protein